GGEERAVPREQELPTAHDAALVDPEHEPEPEQPEECRGDQEIGEVLDRDVDRVLRPHEAALERGESDLHEEDQRGGEKHPGDDKCLMGGHWVTAPARGGGTRAGQPPPDVVPNTSCRNGIDRFQRCWSGYPTHRLRASTRTAFAGERVAWRGRLSVARGAIR